MGMIIGGYVPFTASLSAVMATMRIFLFSISCITDRMNDANESAVLADSVLLVLVTYNDIHHFL